MRPATLRRALLVGAGVAALIVVGVVVWAPQDRAGEPAARGFSVAGNRIVDPRGRPFVLKGVTLLYGTFAGGDGAGLGAANLAQAPFDVRRVRALGANAVRIMVTPPAPADEAATMARLRQAVGWARDAGLVVVLANAFAGPRESLPWLAGLARRFAGDPGVWYTPMSEPGCAPPPPGPTCDSWPAWQREQRAAIAAIRGAGARAPILVNTPHWSSSLDRVDAFGLGDDNVVFGVHAYANDRPAFDPAEAQAAWARVARRHAVVVDEVGAYNGAGFANADAWVRGLVAFLPRWIADGGGAGALGFTWRWSDPNTMTLPDGTLSPWGELFAQGFLARAHG
jgi:Cellulase (glycosyl hydrolase family 5)